MKLHPLGTHVIVARLEEEDKTAGGIIIPDTAREKPQKGKVIAVGKGRILKNGEKKALDVKEGNIVLFGKYSHLTYSNYCKSATICHIVKCGTMW